jgi:hypothetical protein
MHPDPTDPHLTSWSESVTYPDGSRVTKTTLSWRGLWDMFMKAILGR